MLTIAILMTVFLAFFIFFVTYSMIESTKSWGIDIWGLIIGMFVILACAFMIVGTWLLYCRIP